MGRKVCCCMKTGNRTEEILNSITFSIHVICFAKEWQLRNVYAKQIFFDILIAYHIRIISEV